ncbi:MAG: cysteine peptidase family C39 domain-containing protein, partial [Candidatus Brocadiia bacterium]
INSATSIKNINNETITLSDFDSYLKYHENTYFKIISTTVSGDKYISSIVITADLGSNFDYTGKIDSGNVNITDNKITINGSDMAIGAGTIIKDSDGNLIDLSQLEQIVNGNSANSIDTMISIFATRALDGSIIVVNLDVLTKVEPLNTVSSTDTIDSIDGLNIVFGGVTYDLADGFTILNTATGITMTVEELETEMLSYLQLSIPVVATAEFTGEGTEVKIARIKVGMFFFVNSISEASSTITPSMSGQMTIGTALDSFSLGGVVFTVDPSSVVITDAFGSSISWNDLKKFYAGNNTSGIPTYVNIDPEVANDGSTWIWKALKIKLTTDLSSNVGGKLDDADDTANTITVQGRTIDISAASIVKKDGTVLTLQYLYDLFNVSGHVIDDFDDVQRVIVMNGTLYNIAADAEAYDATGAGISLSSLYHIFNTNKLNIISTYAKLTTDGEGNVIKIELNNPPVPIYVDVEVNKASGQLVAHKVTVNIDETQGFTTAEMIDYFSSTTPFVTINGTRVNLDGTSTVLKDLTNPLNPQSIDLTALAQQIRDSATPVYFTADIKKGKNTADTGEIIYGGIRAVDAATRSSIISKVSTWLNTVSGKTTQAITNILSWLNSQSEHFGVSAFDSMALLLNPVKAVTDYAVMAAQMIIKDITGGAISNTPTGQLQISLTTMKEMAALLAGVPQTYAYNISFDQLKASVKAGPVIAHVGGDHYVTVMGVDPYGMVTMYDNYTLTTVTKAQFTAKWSGTVLALTQPATGTPISDASAALIKGAGIEGWLDMGNNVYNYWYGAQEADKEALTDAEALGIVMRTDSYNAQGETTDIRFYAKDPTELSNYKFLYDIQPNNDNNNQDSWIKKIAPDILVPDNYWVWYYTKDTDGSYVAGLVLDYGSSDDGLLNHRPLQALWFPAIDYKYTDRFAGTQRWNTLNALNLTMDQDIPYMPINQYMLAESFQSMMWAYNYYMESRDLFENGQSSYINAAYSAINSAADVSSTKVSAALSQYWSSVSSNAGSYINAMGSEWKNMGSTAFSTYTNTTSSVKTFIQKVMDNWRQRWHWGPSDVYGEGASIAKIVQLMMDAYNAYKADDQYIKGSEMYDWAAPWTAFKTTATSNFDQAVNLLDANKSGSNAYNILQSFTDAISEINTIAVSLGSSQL